jgi:hypothetical protein
MAPLVGYPVRRLVTVPDQLGMGVEQDGRLDLAGVHVLVA